MIASFDRDFDQIAWLTRIDTPEAVSTIFVPETANGSRRMRAAISHHDDDSVLLLTKQSPPDAFIRRKIWPAYHMIGHTSRVLCDQREGSRTPCFSFRPSRKKYL